eukprot:scaffold57056_cov48-Phaeocystis_antarctica.AAC.1
MAPGLASPLRLSSSAHATRSPKEFGLRARAPAACHAAPRSPPPRTCAMACSTPLSTIARRSGHQLGSEHSP